MTREDFLARVRGALHRSAADPVGAPPQPPPSRPDWDGSDLLAEFARQAEAVSTQVKKAEGLEEARRILRELLTDLGASSCLRSSDALIEELLQGTDLPVAREPETADVGITGVHLAIAETGTLVLSSEAGRLAGLLPMAHIAVVREDQVVATLTEAIAWAQRRLPAAWVQATGPSRTADIELTLTTGVHGPGVVHVIALGSTATD